MNSYVGKEKERISFRGLLVKAYHGFSDYGSFNIYTFKDEDDNLLTWKTSTDVMVIKDGELGRSWYPLTRGDFVEVTGTVKNHYTYNKEKQTGLLRCKINYLKSMAIPDSYKTKNDLYKEKQKSLRDKQLMTLSAGDYIWHKMPYRQYKEHYADCETVIGSYCEEGGEALIDVIIRKGRLKESGVRGKHYSVFCFRDNHLNKEVRIKAISEETAYRQLHRDYPEMSKDSIITQIVGYTSNDPSYYAC